MELVETPAPLKIQGEIHGHVWTCLVEDLYETPLQFNLEECSNLNKWPSKTQVGECVLQSSLKHRIS